MVAEELDNVDKGILYLLQQDARTLTTSDIAEKVGVSSSTVSNHIKTLEEREVITGYYPLIDYEKTGLGHHLLVSATVPFEERDEVVDDIDAVPGVVNIRVLLTNSENLRIELVGQDTTDIERSLGELNEHGVDIDGIDIMKLEQTNPYNHFGKQYANEDSSG